MIRLSHVICYYVLHMLSVQFIGIDIYHVILLTLVDLVFANSMIHGNEWIFFTNNMI